MTGASVNLTTAAEVGRALRTHASEQRAKVSRSFFKMARGQYGEGDQFLGVTVPHQRAVARRARGLCRAQTEVLLASPWHEERLTGLLLLVDAYERGDLREREEVAALYLARLAAVNNWDLVDLSAWQILGRHVRAGAPSPLLRLARSPVLWERRVAMVSTYAWIKEGEAEPALGVAEMLVRDSEDLIHKAVGWMLREVGKRAGRGALETFLDAHADTMPRTALRYAIERFPEEERRRWLARGRRSSSPSE